MPHPQEERQGVGQAEWRLFARRKCSRGVDPWPRCWHGLIACVSYQPGDYITWYEGELCCCKPSKLTKAEKDYALQWEKNRSSLIGLRHGNLKPGRGLGSLANDRNLGKVEGPRKKNNARFSLPDKDSRCCWLIPSQLIKCWEEITVTYGPGYRL